MIVILSFYHSIIDGDEAWMDTRTKKLASPTPQIVVEVFNAFPKAEGFEYV
ncbi:MAG: hypothetical protein M3421_16190 [Bacteroidota bacterium]|nr:hypothetical protein [Bacteroidota bacterium]